MAFRANAQSCWQARQAQCHLINPNQSIIPHQFSVPLKPRFFIRVIVVTWIQSLSFIEIHDKMIAYKTCQNERVWRERTKTYESSMKSWRGLSISLSSVSQRPSIWKSPFKSAKGRISSDNLLLPAIFYISGSSVMMNSGLSNPVLLDICVTIVTRPVQKASSKILPNSTEYKQ